MPATKNTATRNRRLTITLALLVGITTLCACSSPRYEGYKYAPYTVKGKRYIPLAPREAIGFREEGIASHYDQSFLLIFPAKTAIGEKQWRWSHGAAHKTLPLPCRVRITNLENGRKVTVRVNDRGPYVAGRIIDVTTPVAKELGFHKKGLARVRIEVLSVGDGKHRIRK